jgi:hypothetical protein
MNLDSSEISLIKWFKFTNDELEFLLGALQREEIKDNPGGQRLRLEVARVIQMRQESPA